MTTIMSNDYKFILNYQDNGSKFVFLFALTNKRNNTIAATLFKLFTLIGPPLILKSDNGGEFNYLGTTQKIKDQLRHT